MAKFFFDSILMLSRSAIIFALPVTLLGSQAFAASELAQTFTLDGELMLSGTTTVLSDAAAKITVEILDPSKTCLLYSEQQTVDTISSEGYFSIQVGSITGASKRLSGDPGLTMAQVYQNTSAVVAANAPSATCASATYTPAANDVRYFRIIVTPSSTNVADTLSPDTVMDAVPMATVAQTLQGYAAADFLTIAGLPTCASGTFLSYNGTTLSCAGVAGASGGTVTSITAGTGLSGGTITSTGTIALTASGVTAATYGSATQVPVIAVDTYGRVTSATNTIISGVIPGGTASGDLAGTYPSPTVNGLSGVALSISSLTSGQYLKYNGTNWINSTLSISDSSITYGSETQNTFLAAPNGSNGTPTFRAIASADLPVVPYTRGGTSLSATPANGQIAIGNGAGYTLGTLTAGSGVTITNAAGSVTIAAAGSGGTVTSVSGTAPISVATGTTTPAISITQATSSTDGYLSSSDWTTFNSKLTGTLADAKIFVGNSSSVATPASMSGDATLADTGALTLAASGVTAGTYPKVTVNAKGLVTSGTTLAASDITTALGYTPVNKAGDSINGNLTFAASIGNIYTAGSGANTVTVEGPSGAIGTSYVLRLPTSVASSAGQVLTSDTSGNLSWSTPSTTATSYSGILPIANGGTNSSTALNNNQLMVSSSGKIIEAGALTNGQLFIGSTGAAPVAASITAGSGITITPAAGAITIATTGLQASSLANGDIWVGQSGTPTAVAPSGDVAMTNAGAFTVTQIQGKAVSATAPTTAGQTLRYNGTSWTPNFISMADLRSTITGASALTSCSSSQTLTWSVATDNLACSNITVSGTQVTYASQTANTVFAAPNGSAGTPTFRGIAAADLPTIAVSGGGTGATMAATARTNLGAAANGANADITSTSVLTSIASSTSAITIAPTGALNLSPSTAVVSSAVYEAPLGTAAAPSYTNSTATATGMYFPTSTSLGFSTAGANTMTILSGGNVGIGTTAPLALLQVGASTVTPYYSSGITAAHLYNPGFTAMGNSAYSVSGGYVIGDNTNSVLAGMNYTWATNELSIQNAATAGYVEFYTNGGPAMRIAHSGSVGIGTTSPGGALDVEGTGSRLNVVSGGTQTVTDGTTQVGIISENKFAPVSSTTTVAGIGAYAVFAPPSGVTITSAAQILTSSGAASGSAGTVTNGYGLYVQNPAFATNNYAAYFGGSVGIGTTNPGSTFEVDSTSTTGNAIFGSTTTAAVSGVIGKNTSSGAYGALGFSTFGIYCASGTCGGVAAWTNTSDRRLKNDIHPIPDALNKVLKLEGVSYHWKDAERNKKEGQKIGLIAQNVEEVFPQAIKLDTVSENHLPGGTKMVAYTDLIGPLVQAIKELYGKWFDDSESLHREIASVKQENSELKAELCKKDPTYSFCQKKITDSKSKEGQ